MADLTCPLSLFELLTWCPEENVNPAHAVVSGVPSDTNIADVKEVVETVKAFGKVRVRAQKSIPQVKGDMMLCETHNKVEPSQALPEILPPSGESPWELTLIVENTDNRPDEFSNKLLSLLASEGKTIADIEPLLTQAKTVRSEDTSSIIRAVGDLLEKVRPPQENNVFCCLHVFSGISPTPAGEETLDTWLEQVQLMLDECDCLSKEKRKRIVESLKGPAVKIIQVICCNDPDATPQGYLAAIENVFGISESGEDLYFKFCSMQQKPK
ncbi:paraneoplastic antigen Ma1 homolog [Pholidichthys leucotaenia]